MHHFEKSVKVGERGERLFQENFIRPLIRTGGKDHVEDFLIKDTFLSIELKSENYRIANTPNFFIERYSDERAKTNGGPWRSLTVGIDYYIHYFFEDNTWFIFHPEEIVPILDFFILTGKAGLPCYIPNKGYEIRGYKVPRRLMEPYEAIIR